MNQRSQLALWKSVAPWFAISTAVFAQSVPPTPVSDEQATVLSVFQVSSTQDKGYIATSATPFKTRQNLADIPQAIAVVTRDMIDDIGAYNSSDILIYAGAIPKFRGEAYALRGSNTSITIPLIDGHLDRTILMDNGPVLTVLFQLGLTH